MISIASNLQSAVAPIHQIPYVYRCSNCGHFEELLLRDDIPQGDPFTCHACLYCVHLFSLDIGSPGLDIRWHARPSSFKRAQYLNVLQVWWAGRISTLQAFRGLMYPATTIWFADGAERGMVCVCPEILAILDDIA